MKSKCVLCQKAKATTLHFKPGLGEVWLCGKCDSRLGPNNPRVEAILAKLFGGQRND